MTAEIKHSQAVLPKSERLLSLDALRGFNMLWIIGLGVLVSRLSNAGALPEWAGNQMNHVFWGGFHFEDLIFPLFVFITGATIPLASSSRLDPDGSRWRIVGQLIRRATLLILLGMVYNGVFCKFNGLANAGLGSVLGVIGIGWFFAALICMGVTVRGQALWATGILAVCAASLLWIPVPGHGAGVITPEGAFPSWLDREFWPGNLYCKIYSGMGFMPCASAVSIALLGNLATRFIREGKWKLGGHAKALWLAGSGAFLALAAWTWAYWVPSAIAIPMLKGQFSPSFVLFAVGWSLLLLALFYWFVDVLKWKWLGFPFIVIGSNAITIYLLCRIVGFGSATRFLFGGVAGLAGGQWSSIILGIGTLAIEWGFLYFLYRKKLFIRV